MPAPGEVVVFVVLERVSPADRRYRGVTQALRHVYPLLVLGKPGGRTGERAVAFLKRHEAVWANMFRLLGWRATANRYEMPLEELRRLYGELRGLQGALRGLGRAPGWLAQHIKPGVSLGGLPLDSLLGFVEQVERRFAEYREAPAALRSAGAARTSFLKHLRNSELLAITVVVGDRDGQYRKVNELLYELLRRGIVPIDYSHNEVIVAKPARTARGARKPRWSVLGFDPGLVLRGLQTRYCVVEAGAGVEFEERDVGWGLRLTARWQAP